MDPLIRKVNSDNEIAGLNIGMNGECIDKVCGYAGDIVFIIKGTHPLTPNSGFTPGTPVFTHFTSARRRYALVTQKDRKKLKG